MATTKKLCDGSAKASHAILQADGGSESIHVHILKTELRLSEKSRVAISPSIGLEVNRIREKDYTITTEQGPKTGPQVTEDLIHQLEERLYLVSRAVVMHLLHELAPFEAQTATLERAIFLDKLAVDYGMPPSLVSTEMQKWNATIQRTQFRAGLRQSILPIICIIGCILFVIRLRAKRAARKAEAS